MSTLDSAPRTPSRFWQPVHAEVLEFERPWWKHPGLKEQAVRDVFGLSPVQYYAVLAWAREQPEAVRYDAHLTARLQRVANERRLARSARRLTGEVTVPHQSGFTARREPAPRRLPTSAMQLLAYALITGASLASRPHGVMHLYRGPLTRSGRFVPRDSQVVCRTTTARLTVRDTLSVVHGVYEGAVEVCGTCSTRLASSRNRVGRVEHTPRARLVQVFDELPAWVVPALERIGAPVWEDDYDHRCLSLVRRVTARRDIEWPAGTRHPEPRVKPVDRYLVADEDLAQAEADFDAAMAEHEAREKTERRRRWLEREDQIARHGISAVQPTPRRRAS